MAAAEKLLFSIIEGLCIPDDRLLPLAFDETLENSVEKVCKDNELKSDDLRNLQIALVGLGAITDVVNQVMGADKMGISNAEMSFSPVITLLDELDTDSEHLVSAHCFLEQAETFLRLENYQQLVEQLGKVNTRATDALSSGTKIDDLLMATKLLILVDVFSQSVITSKKTPEIELVPVNSLERSKRGNMVIHATTHLQRLVKRLNKKNISADGIRKILTLNNQNREVEKTYGTCVQWVTPKIEILEEDTFKVSLPPLHMIPDVDSPIRNLILSFPRMNGSGKHALSLCKEWRYGKEFLFLGYFGKIYSITLQSWESKFYKDDEVIDVTIKGNEVKAQHEKDMTDRRPGYGEYCVWEPRDIRSVVASCLCGDISSVNGLSLTYSNPYNMDDMKDAMQILGVAKSLYLSPGSLPDCMGEQDWQNLASSTTGLESFEFNINYSEDDDMQEIDENSGSWIGRLAVRSKKAELHDIKFANFVKFCESLAFWLKEDGAIAICEEIGFKWRRIVSHKDEVLALMDKIGWKKKEPENEDDIDDDDCVVIVK